MEKSLRHIVEATRRRNRAYGAELHRLVKRARSKLPAVASEQILRIVAWSEDHELNLDIVDLNALSPEFRRQVEEEGIVLYEKEG
jgi:hypothetical protein